MPIKSQITIEETIKLLNEAVQADAKAMRDLIESRVECNATFAAHPTIQVANYHKKDAYTVGLLGILNGLFGIDDKGWGSIAAVFSVDCPRGHETPELAGVGELCSTCKEELILGKLEGFENRYEREAAIDIVSIFTNEKVINCAGCRCEGVGKVTKRIKPSTGRITRADNMVLPADWDYRPFGNVGGKAPYCANCLEKEEE